MDAVHLPISFFPGQPFATEPVRVAKLWAILSVLPFPVASSMREIICCIYSAVVPRCRGERGSVLPLLTHTSLPGLSASSHLFIFSDIPFTSETLAQRGEDSGDSLPPYPHHFLQFLVGNRLPCGCQVYGLYLGIPGGKGATCTYPFLSGQH